MRWSRIAATLVAALGMAGGLLVGPAQATTSAAPKITVRSVAASAGDCTVDFSARINVKLRGKPVKVTYRWISGDGSKGKIRTAWFYGRGWKGRTVRDSQSFDEDVRGWQAVHVVSPRRLTSARAYFATSGCGGGEEPEPRPHVSVSVGVDDGDSVGTCDGSTHKVRFLGAVRVDDGPANVHYTWRLDGSVVKQGWVRVHDRERLGYDYLPVKGGDGVMTLSVRGPDNGDADRVGFKVTCKAPEPGRVTGAKLGTIKQDNGGCPNYVALELPVLLETTGSVKVTWKARIQRVGGGGVDTETFTSDLNGAGWHSVQPVSVTIDSGYAHTLVVTILDPKPEASYKVFEATYTCP